MSEQSMYDLTGWHKVGCRDSDDLRARSLSVASSLHENGAAPAVWANASDLWRTRGRRRMAIALAAALPVIEAELRERLARELLAVDPIEWALAGTQAGKDAASIVRGGGGE